MNHHYMDAQRVDRQRFCLKGVAFGAGDEEHKYYLLYGAHCFPDRYLQFLLLSLFLTLSSFP